MTIGRDDKPRSRMLMALDAMIESVQEDIRNEDMGNHATIGALHGELKGLRAARMYSELDASRSASAAKCATCDGIGVIALRAPTDEDDGTEPCPDCGERASPFHEGTNNTAPQAESDTVKGGADKVQANPKPAVAAPLPNESAKHRPEVQEVLDMIDKAQRPNEPAPYNFGDRMRAKGYAEVPSKREAQRPSEGKRSPAGYTRDQARACDWVEDFTHENGNYWNFCVECERQFVGHKRRVLCKLCASPSHVEQQDFVCLKEPRCKAPCGGRNCHVAALPSAAKQGETPRTDAADDPTMRFSERHNRLKVECGKLERELAGAQAQIALDTGNIERIRAAGEKADRDLAKERSKVAALEESRENWMRRAGASPSSSAQQEPFAWFTEHDGGGAQCRLTIYEKPTKKVPGVEWTPLYLAAPSATQDTARLDWLDRREFGLVKRPNMESLTVVLQLGDHAPTFIYERAGVKTPDLRDAIDTAMCASPDGRAVDG